MPDSKTGRILDTYGIEHFKNDDFSTGLTAVYNSLVNEVCIEKGIEPDENYNSVSDNSADVGAARVIKWIVILIILFIFIFPGFRRRRRGTFIFFPPHGGGFSGGGFGGSGGFSGGSSGGGFSGGGGSFGGGGSSRGF